MTPVATVVITTKNRCDSLRTALSSVVNQSVPLEVVVIDDGSRDGTSDMVRAEFSSAILVRNDVSAGLIVRRNEGARLATTNWIVSIDDDAEFVSSRTVAQGLAAFDDARIGAVALPFIEPLKGDVRKQFLPHARERLVLANFAGGAHIVRRDVFRQVGGYRASLFHQGEERDFCDRMLASGHVVVMCAADPFHHYESPVRDAWRIDVYGRRNDVLYGWHNAPGVHLPLHMLATTLNGLKHGVASRRFLRACRGLAKGFADIPSLWGERSPLPPDVYRLAKRLRSDGPLPFHDVCSALDNLLATRAPPASQ